MPARAPRPCAAPACGALVESGYCPHHAHRARLGPRKYDDRRGSSAGRGYDADWRRFRAAFLAEHPECEDCRGVSRCVHHKIKLRERPDLRLEPSNCRALCKCCHDRRTQRGE